MHTRIEKAVKKTNQVSQMNKAKARDMKVFFSGNNLPPAVMQMLPSELFRGRLVESEFLTVPSEDISLPPRLPLVLASVIQQKVFEVSEVVYQNGDQSMHIYLVLRGTFGYMGVPGVAGGHSFTPPKIVKSAFSGGRWKQRAAWKTLDEEDDDDEEVNVAEDEDRQEKQRLFPYMLLGKKKYFGEFEVMHRDAPTRQAYVQCLCEDNDGAAVLMLQKNDFMDLKSEYPNFGDAWLAASTRKEGHRVRALTECTTERWHGKVSGQGRRQSGNGRYLAVITIQRFYCEHIRKRSSPKHREDLRDSAAVASKDHPISPPAGREAFLPRADPPRMSKSSTEGHLFRSPRKEHAGDVRQLCSTVAQIDDRVSRLQDTVDKLVQELRTNRHG